MSSKHQLYEQVDKDIKEKPNEKYQHQNLLQQVLKNIKS
jgi:hypothetical protein